MGFDFRDFNDGQLNEDFVEWLIDEHSMDAQRHFAKLWDYYQNRMYPMSSIGAADSKVGETSRTYVQAQELGLPARITGIMRSEASGAFGGKSVTDIERKEIVIENDISWRINAMVDFLFGKGVDIVSKVKDPDRKAEIEKIIGSVFSVNGGVRFFQDMAVLGSIYGFVDCIVRPGRKILERMAGGGCRAGTIEEAVFLAGDCVLELIEAPRSMPVLDERDYRRINYYIQQFNEQKNAVSSEGGFLRKLVGGSVRSGGREAVSVTEVIGAEMWQRYENKTLVEEGPNVMGIVPVVHIQNMAQPLYYEGLSDVEPLIPLQDELNTRLSDRASRITFQSFKMYLAKGIDGIENRSISPGRMWCTDNTEASIESFGGDHSSPSEDVHIAEIREAMDKTSGVTPVAAGVLRNKIGNLTSAVALRMTLMGMLAKTERKQNTYGQGLKQISAMVMHLLDVSGVYPNEPSERVFEIIFPSPLPENTMEKLEEAKIKRGLGVPAEQVLRELGYNA